MILTGLPGVIVSRARRSAWRGEGWEQGSQRLWKPRGGCRRSAGPQLYWDLCKGSGLPLTPGWVPGRKGAFAGVDRVLTGGWRTHCRRAANLTCIFWAWLPELIGVAPGLLYKAWLLLQRQLPSQGSGGPGLPTESQGDLSHALASDLCSGEGHLLFQEHGEHGGQAASLGPGGLVQGSLRGSDHSC